MVKKNVRMEPKIESFKLSQLKEASYKNPRTITADGVYDDSDGLKWIYDRIQAEQALQEKK